MTPLADIFLTIAPLFFVVLLGYGLRKTGLFEFGFWEAADRLSYWVFFPCMLFSAMVKMQGQLSQNIPTITAAAAGFGAAWLFSLALLPRFRGALAAWTSLLQGNVRHNTYIIFASALLLYGDAAFEQAAIVAAVLIPAVNLSIVPAMSWVNGGNQTISAKLRATVLALLSNPLILAIVFGLLLNPIKSNVLLLSDTTDLLGRAGLPIVLLCIGSALRPRQLGNEWSQLLLALIGKHLVYSAAIIACAMTLELSLAQAQISLLFGLVGAATSSYSLANQLGGDAPLMSSILTVQTLFSMLTIPLGLSLLPLWFV
ncbi:MAG: AEC family transporter [Gammaproteobacteria bacterium]|nr:AEC family transporter [Gammaproteobacteria bacterium]